MRIRDPRFWLLTLLLVAAAGSAPAATLNVAVGGVDADGCGTKAAPCRSITRAIFAAVPGDKILVGPGRYGDLDGDGIFGEPGEENGTNSAVQIDKAAVVVESTTGASWTVIDVGGATRIGVRISADGVRLGKAKKGFTITRSGISGVLLDAGVNDVVVSGIRSVRNKDGFASKATGSTFRSNVAEGNTETGFSLGGPATVTACRASANGGVGFSIGGNGSLVKGNVAAGNGDAGFEIAGDAITLVGSVASGNAIGVRVLEGFAPKITASSIVGNAEAGVVVVSADVTIAKSNVFGNGSIATNCGVNVTGAGSAALDEVCFGAPTGPGDDPADEVCGGGVQILEILAKELKVSPKVPL